MLFLQSRMFYSTCEMSNVEVDNIFCIGFLHWDSKRVEWMKCESHKSLPCWWDGATQKSCMDFELKKPWISGIEPVRKKTYKFSKYKRIDWSISYKGNKIELWYSKIVGCLFVFPKLCAFVLWCGYFSVSFQPFIICHLVIAPVHNTHYTTKNWHVDDPLKNNPI